MSDKFGDNLCWFLTEVSCMSESDIELAGAVVEIVGENESGIEGRTEVSIPELCNAAGEEIEALKDEIRILHERLEDTENALTEAHELFDAG